VPRYRPARGRVALVTGASSGLGAEFARQLAAMGHGLVLVARRQEQLSELAAALRRLHGVGVEVLAADLSSPGDMRAVAERIGRLPQLSLLVNNAGFGVEGDFASGPVDPQAEMARVHVEAVLRLTGAALPVLAAAGGGGIINVSSVAAFVVPGGAPAYSATKAFLVAFTRNLQDQVAGEGIVTQALCPGYTVTEFHEAMRGGGRRPRLPRFLWLRPEKVVAASLSALLRGRPVVVVPGWQYRLAVLLLRLGLGRLAGRVREASKRGP
jgi:short-subunit dehydrogenase